MFQGWRLQLREAEEAFEQGRLDEASRLIAEGRLEQYLPGARLAAKVAERLGERARRFLAGGETSAGWRDLQTAEKLVGETDRLLSVRQALVKRAISEAEMRLEADDPAGALSRVEWLGRRGVSGDQLRSLEQVARRMESARNLCRHGRFAEAEAQLESALALRPDLGFLAERRNACRAGRVRSRELTEQMHRAMLVDDWSRALSLADELLELAPEYAIAVDARRRAWKMVDSRKAAAAAHLGETRQWAPPSPKPARDSQVVAGPRALQPTAAVASGANGAEREFEASFTDDRPGRTFALWVDGVGGYLVCLGDEVVIGQASPENVTGPSRVDVAIRGDLYRRHAVIHRRGETYTIEPLGPVRVGGRRIHDCTLLCDGAEVVLGEGVRLRFSQPHPLSATARLEHLSRHRSQPYSDAVLLMAESCVLGPQLRNHVVCRDWPNDLVLFRQGEELRCRTMQQVEIDGRLCDGQSPVKFNSRIVGENFSVTLEEV
jgi:tetratricopeptide (TPR) repeat protein